MPDHLHEVGGLELGEWSPYLSDVADAVIVGCGVQGYELAIARIAHLAADAARSA